MLVSSVLLPLNESLTFGFVGKLLCVGALYSYLQIPDAFVVPIFLPGMNADWFAANAAYPLPQALVLTSIVIGASTLAVMLALAMVLYRKHGTLSVSEMMGDEK